MNGRPASKSHRLGPPALSLASFAYSANAARVITIVALGIVKTWHEVIRGIRSGSHKELKT